jgi:hypothetical protein
MRMTKARQVQLLIQWRYFCESIGWKREDIAALTDIFWKYKGWKTFKGYQRQFFQESPDAT